jgi:hypothetical protein
MYQMAQDSPESTGAVWSRRIGIGIFQNAHAKRLRGIEFVHQEEDEEDHQLITAWPSAGKFLLLRTLGHTFPVTDDRRHYVVSPTMLLFGRMVAQTLVGSPYDLVIGTLCYKGCYWSFRKRPVGGSQKP